MKKSILTLLAAACIVAAGFLIISQPSQAKDKKMQQCVCSEGTKLFLYKTNTERPEAGWIINCTCGKMQCAVHSNGNLSCVK